MRLCRVPVAASEVTTAAWRPAGSRAEAPRVGVCFSGWLGVSVSSGGRSIADHLIKPLAARVLLALTYHARDRCDTVASCRIAERLAALQPFSRVSLSPMLSLETLVSTMESLPHWRRIIAAYNRGRTVSCKRHEGWMNSTSGPPYACRNIYLGNTIFAPVLGSARLHVLRQLHDIRRCLGVVSEDEDAAGGLRYDRIVHSRLEFIWLAPHPPLRLLHSSAVWIPSGGSIASAAAACALSGRLFCSDRAHATHPARFAHLGGATFL